MNTKAKNNFFGKTKEYGYIQPFGVSDLNERYDKEFKNLQKNENKKYRNELANIKKTLNKSCHIVFFPNSKK